MKIARVVGNVVSTVKEETHYSKKLMIIEYLDLDLKPTGVRLIAFDAADAGIGDIVITSHDGGSAKMILEDKEVIADITIAGVLEHFSADGKITQTF